MSRDNWSHAEALRRASASLEPTREETRRLVQAVTSRRRRRPIHLGFGAAAGGVLAGAAILIAVGVTPTGEAPAHHPALRPEPEVCLVWSADPAFSLVEPGFDPVCEPLAG